MASLVSTCHTSTVGTRHVIGHSLPSAGYGCSKGGSNEPKLLSWTLPEMQRLIWRLIWSTPSSLTAVCHWSFWRRRKQERARQFHYRRHAQRARPSRQVLSVGKPNRQSYPTNLSDQQWADAQRVIPIHRVGRPCKIDLRQVLNAFCYMQASHCSWRMLPKEFPCWQTVSSYLYRWRQQGVWESICKAIRTNET